MIELLASLFCVRRNQQQYDHRRELRKQMLCETERFLDRGLRGCDAVHSTPLMTYRRSYQLSSAVPVKGFGSGSR
jgi:hypothetical protein